MKNVKPKLLITNRLHCKLDSSNKLYVSVSASCILFDIYYKSLLLSSKPHKNFREERERDRKALWYFIIEKLLGN